MGTKSRERIYGSSIRAAAERATEARREADRLACNAWNKRISASPLQASQSIVPVFPALQRPTVDKLLRPANRRHA
jgi:hypothetical protein